MTKPTQRRRSWILSMAVCWLPLPVVADAGTAATAKPNVRTIVIEAVAYRPAALVVKRGDTVIWLNKDPFPHTVTAQGAFDSHEIAPGASWKYVARRSGEYAYICTLHPNMKGTLSVQ